MTLTLTTNDGYLPQDPLYRPLPANLEAEKSLLGAIFTQNRAHSRVAGFLRPEHFALLQHGRIFEACSKLIGRGQIADVVTLRNLFQEDESLGEVGGPAYLAELAASTVTIINAVEYGRIIRDLYVKRRLIEMGQALIDSAHDPDLQGEELLAAKVGELQRLGADWARTGMTKRQVAEALVVDLEKPTVRSSTGLPAIDRSMGGGMYAGKLYGIAARKKVGKTLLLGGISHNLAKAKEPHLFIALETMAAEIEQRNIAREGGFNSIRFLLRDDARLSQRVAEYAVEQTDAVVYENSPGATFDQIRAVVSRHIAGGKIKGVILDYLQMIGGKAKNDTEEYHLRSICDWLAATARKENIWVLIAAQVNQDGNTRGGEGLRLACDQYYTLNREKDSDAAWMEMGESRYTLYQNVGSDSIPGLILNKHGPHFEDPTDLPIAKGQDVFGLGESRMPDGRPVPA